MRKGDDLYFAPDVLFTEVNLGDISFVNHLRKRIDGYYFAPTRLCIAQGHAFGAGVLLVSTIDFLAGLHRSADELSDRPVGRDFRGFVRSQLPSFRSQDLAQRLWDDFRNGLTHEARIKNAGEFSFDRKQTVCLAGGRLCINPHHLLEEVEAALQRSMDTLVSDEAQRQDAAARLRTLFTVEFWIVQRARAS